MRYFYPRSPCGERQRAEIHASTQQEFLSTLSLRRATYLVRGQRLNWPISIHALLAESDCVRCFGRFGPADFYPRSPCGERRVPETLVPRRNQFLSTLSLRRATDSAASRPRNNQISIHALLAESDPSSTVIVLLRKNLYPRAPCGERHWAVNIQRPTAEFLSTLSLRRATRNIANSKR